MCVCECMCVCVCERERERERETILKIVFCVTRMMPHVRTFKRLFKEKCKRAWAVATIAVAIAVAVAVAVELSRLKCRTNDWKFGMRSVSVGAEPGNSNYKGMRTVDLLVKVTCFVQKAHNIFNIKGSLSRLFSTRRSTVPSVSLLQGFLGGSRTRFKNVFKNWSKILKKSWHFCEDNNFYFQVGIHWFKSLWKLKIGASVIKTSYLSPTNLPNTSFPGKSNVWGVKTKLANVRLHRKGISWSLYHKTYYYCFRNKLECLPLYTRLGWKGITHKH
jgi:hypothetical protein